MPNGTRQLGVQPGTTAALTWRIAQAVSLSILIVLMAGLIWEPDLSLLVLWNVLIPIVPASLLISPVLWRGVCPLATLNMSTNGLITRKRANGSLLTYSSLVGIGLLLLLVPARHVLFNQNAIALAVTITVVGVLALAGGAVFDAKAGFCSTVCPVLPVERLYGQQPLVNLNNPRCPTCTHCTSRGCIDLSPTASVAQILGRNRLSFAWLTSGFGIFAASFPGFVAGYYLTDDTLLSSAWSVYLNVLVFSLASYLLFSALIRLVRLRTASAMTLLAGSAAGLYYWFAAPGIADAFGQPVLAPVIRSLGLALVAYWFWNGRRTTSNA